MEQNTVWAFFWGKKQRSLGLFLGVACALKVAQCYTLHVNVSVLKDVL